MSYPGYSEDNPRYENPHPEEYNYQNPDILYPTPGVFDQTGQFVNYYNPPNYSEPLMINPSPIMPGQAIAIPQFNGGEADLPPSQPVYRIHPYSNRINSSRQRSSPAMVFMLVLVIRTVLMIVTLNIYWFNYCYWDFSLTYRDSSFGNNDYSDGSIKSLYNDACDPDRDKYSSCPDLCDSIKNVRYSGEKLLGLGITACVFSGISVLVAILKYWYRSSRVLNWIIYLSILASALFYTIGVINYKSESKFDDNFHKVKKPKYYNGDDPDNFSWSGGYYVSIVAMCLSWVLVILSKFFTSSIGRN